ncbi:hypothetical protein AXG93_2779s1120 [Marchantia polymorpha subsp. ruderalis]|uniref:Uncharacterized protein n=1 Tax=Marchantia polymorpha subsp. ruderalis TaxID=1480154 RepID=A0A176W3F4_MARPO|nr:hypothetical protein AXG93_2779s1120 [Marchantia polymorpha subsp. ruderalis]
MISDTAAVLFDLHLLSATGYRFQAAVEYELEKSNGHREDDGASVQIPEFHHKLFDVLGRDLHKCGGFSGRRSGTVSSGIFWRKIQGQMRPSGPGSKGTRRGEGARRLSAISHYRQPAPSSWLEENLVFLGLSRPVGNNPITSTTLPGGAGLPMTSEDSLPLPVVWFDPKVFLHGLDHQVEDATRRTYSTTRHDDKVDSVGRKATIDPGEPSSRGEKRKSERIVSDESHMELEQVLEQQFALTSAVGSETRHQPIETQSKSLDKIWMAI